jgi:two-component system sensor histidine kinase PilS (NtrC family)
MRTPFRVSDEQLRLVLDRRVLVRWVYLVRFAVVVAIYLGALSNFPIPTSEARITALLFGAALVFTALSAWYSESRRDAISESFLYLQHIFDALLVTAIVHVTGGGESQFAALYILVNTSAALLLPIGGSLLLAILGCVLYAADVLILSEADPTGALLQQLAVFFLVALGTGIIGGRLKAMSSATEGLAEELTQVRLQAADILRNIRSGIITVDDRGLLVYANPAAEELLGTGLEVRIGRAVMPLLEEVSVGLAAATARALHEGAHAQREEALLTVSGRQVPIGITTTSNVTEVPSARSVTVIFQDITDQKRVEEFKRRAERLEAVAELSASLAHEIKNPLASIRSAVEQLSGGRDATADEQVLGRLVVRESDRLSRLLSEFLDFARTRVTSVGVVDVAALARGAGQVARSHPARNEGVQVIIEVPDAPVPVDGDEDLLHRALFNLILNALQATPAGGHVRVSVSDAPPSPLPPGIVNPVDALVLTVTDDGPGIAPDVRARLFEPFTTTKPGGSGLGLSVVHRAVEAHRGLILVDSDASGTTFRILLPRRQVSGAFAVGADT